MTGFREKIIGGATILGWKSASEIWMVRAYCQGDSGDQIKDFVFSECEAFTFISLESSLQFATALAVQECVRESRIRDNSGKSWKP
jgi:hypothetical protein